MHNNYYHCRICGWCKYKISQLILYVLDYFSLQIWITTPLSRSVSGIPSLPSNISKASPSGTKVAIIIHTIFMVNRNLYVGVAVIIMHAC